MRFPRSTLILLFKNMHSNPAFFWFNCFGLQCPYRERLMNLPTWLCSMPHHCFLLSPSPTPNLSSTARVLHINKWTDVGGIWPCQRSYPLTIQALSKPETQDHFLWWYQGWRPLTGQRLQASSLWGHFLGKGQMFLGQSSKINPIECCTLSPIADFQSSQSILGVAVLSLFTVIKLL